MRKLRFLGAAQEVTGSCYLLENSGYKILLEWTKNNYCPLTSLEIIALISNNIKKIKT